jgi:hypothetical protein
LYFSHGGSSLLFYKFGRRKVYEEPKKKKMKKMINKFVGSDDDSLQCDCPTKIDSQIMTSQVELVKNSQVPEEITSLDDKTSQEELVKNSQVPQGTSSDPGTSQQE